MKVAIDIENIHEAKSCRFGMKCLEGFNTSLCCEIQSAGSDYLIVTPVSTFKSSNCSYVRQIKDKGQDVHICTCPIRFEIYRKYNI